MTLDGFIFWVIMIYLGFWLFAHWYDDWQARRVQRAFRRDKR
jgi:hypothetical protein